MLSASNFDSNWISRIRIRILKPVGGGNEGECPAPDPAPDCKLISEGERDRAQTDGAQYSTWHLLRCPWSGQKYLDTKQTRCAKYEYFRIVFVCMCVL